MLLAEVPATRSNHQSRRLVVELVGLLSGVEPQLAPVGVDQIGLAFEEVEPGRRGGVLEVGHEDPGPRVERVDHHLGVDRSGDLDPAVGHVDGHRVDDPVRLPDMPGLAQKAWLLPIVELALPGLSLGEELAPLPAEFLFQIGEKRDRFRVEDPAFDLGISKLVHKMTVSLPGDYHFKSS